MTGESSEQFYADFKISREVPQLETAITDKDLLIYGRQGKRMWKHLKEEGVLIRNHGTWEFALGYVDKTFGGLQRGDLRGCSFADVGGGAYNVVGRSFGPDLAKALNYFGADVTVIDPAAQINDFLSDELQHITVVPETIESFISHNDVKKMSMLTSVNFFGSPHKPVYTEEDCMAAIKTLRQMAKLSDLQFHTITNYDLINWQLFVELCNRQGVDSDLNIKYAGDATLQNKNEKKKIPSVDFLIVDNR